MKLYLSSNYEIHQKKNFFQVDGKIELGRPQTGDAVLVKTQGKLKDGTIVDDNPVNDISNGNLVKDISNDNPVNDISNDIPINYI